jgi:hypothetical protein
VNLETFRRPPREYGILPFWFLNGELAPDEMRFQLKEFRQQGMPGIILHGRYGLEMPISAKPTWSASALPSKKLRSLGCRPGSTMR